MRRHNLKNEREKKENSRAPPRGLRKNRPGLPYSNERIRRRARTAEVRGESASLSCLEENRSDEDERIDYEDYEKKLIQHLVCLGDCTAVEYHESEERESTAGVPQWPFYFCSGHSFQDRQDRQELRKYGVVFIKPRKSRTARVGAESKKIRRSSEVVAGLAGLENCDR